jgi:hypothetical protein
MCIEVSGVVARDGMLAGVWRAASRGALGPGQLFTALDESTSHAESFTTLRSLRAGSRPCNSASQR